MLNIPIPKKNTCIQLSLLDEDRVHRASHTVRHYKYCTIYELDGYKVKCCFGKPCK